MTPFPAFADALAGPMSPLNCLHTLKRYSKCSCTVPAVTRKSSVVELAFSHCM